MFDGKLKAFTLSFDDGVTQDARLIELLNKYNLKCTFNLNSECLGKTGKLWLKDYKGENIVHNKVRPEEVKDLYKGHEVAVHTLTHPNLTLEKDDNEVIRQVEQDRLNLSELVGYEVIGMAYPCGAPNCDDRVANLIKNNTGVRYSRTVPVSGSFEPYPDLYQYKGTAYLIEGWDRLLDLAKTFIELKATTPTVYYLWGHAYELDLAEDGWDKMEEFCKLISGKDDIFYGTNKEILLK